jgi:nitrous oxidase accessory protein NosD
MFGVALVWEVQPVLGKSIIVGTCPGATFSTISAAVSSASAGDTVQVCPGTYPEQVTISTPLTLRGIISGNTDRAVITVPTGGLVVNAHSVVNGLAYAAQVLVTTGAVNISDLTVDGTGNNLNGSAAIAGIFYESGSSGTVRQMATRQQIDNGLGDPIFAENAGATPGSLTIANCSIHDFDGNGILLLSNQKPPQFTATIRGNIIAANGIGDGIEDQLGGSVTENVIVDPSSVGIGADSLASIAVSRNTVTNTLQGIIANTRTGGSITSNTITGTSLGAILLETSNNTVQSNTIKNASVGIGFLCIKGNTVLDNTISDARVGIDKVPSSQAVTNTYHNVDTIRTDGCG